MAVLHEGKSHADCSRPEEWDRIENAEFPLVGKEFYSIRNETWKRSLIQFSGRNRSFWTFCNRENAVFYFYFIRLEFYNWPVVIFVTSWASGGYIALNPDFDVEKCNALAR